MRKKIKKICMAVVLFMMALSLAGTVNAAEPAGSGDQYIYYEEGLLDDGASRVLNSRAAEVSGAYDKGPQDDAGAARTGGLHNLRAGQPRAFFLS